MNQRTGGSPVANRLLIAVAISLSGCQSHPPKSQEPAAVEAMPESPKILSCKISPDAPAEGVAVRAEAAANGAAVRTLGKDAGSLQRLDTLSTPRGDWIQVQTDGVRGWLPAEHLVCPIPAAQARELAGGAVTAVLTALQAKDMAALAKQVHPVKGVRFSPYAFLDRKTNVRYTAEELRGAFRGSAVRLWGTEDGSGKPIRLSFPAYFERFVQDRAFAAGKITYNEERQQRGTTKDNSSEEYPNAIIAESFVPGSDPEREGAAWAVLRLVFEQHQGQWHLVHVIHDQWTI